MAEDPAMIRHWNLVQMLGARHQGITVRELAREMDVGERRSGAIWILPAKVRPGRGADGDRGRKAWWLGEAWSRPPLVFNFEEATALYLGRQFLEPMAGTPFWEAASGPGGRSAAPWARRLGYLDRFARMFHAAGTGHRDYASKAAILEDLTIAMEEHRAVHITYRSEQATEPATRDVYPLSWTGRRTRCTCWPSPRSTTVFARTRSTGSRRSRSAPSSSSCTATSMRRRTCRGRWGSTTATGTSPWPSSSCPHAARHAQESRWHQSKVFTPQRDGSLILRLRLSSTVEIRGRVLAYGAAAVVMEPESLRTEIAAELERMLQAYRTAGMSTRDRASS